MTRHVQRQHFRAEIPSTWQIYRYAMVCCEEGARRPPKPGNHKCYWWPMLKLKLNLMNYVPSKPINLQTGCLSYWGPCCCPFQWRDAQRTAGKPLKKDGQLSKQSWGFLAERHVLFLSKVSKVFPFGNRLSHQGPESCHGFWKMGDLQTFAILCYLMASDLGWRPPFVWGRLLLLESPGSFGLVERSFWVFV